jgi:hypothetical protein
VEERRKDSGEKKKVNEVYARCLKYFCAITKLIAKIGS